jgi:beta-glucosidase
VGHALSDCTLDLPAEQQRYIDHYRDQGVKVIVVLISGRPLLVTEQIEQADAFVAAWLPGSEGDGVAEVLFGDYNFTGKLPHSWPGAAADMEGLYGPNFWDDAIEPLFEYGFGLQY